MVSWKVTVENPVGLHMRPACRICEEALKYRADITMKKGDVSADAKSLLKVLGACVRCGDEIEFVFDGIDEAEAMNAIKTVFAESLLPDEE